MFDCFFHICFFKRIKVAIDSSCLRMFIASWKMLGTLIGKKCGGERVKFTHYTANILKHYASPEVRVYIALRKDD